LATFGNASQAVQVGLKANPGRGENAIAEQLRGEGARSNQVPYIHLLELNALKMKL
jgi:hypothetical protein